MHKKTFNDFLESKETDVFAHPINEGIGDWLGKIGKFITGDINIDEEESNLSFAINNAFRNFTNKLVKMGIRSDRAASIYRNLKNNLKNVIKTSYYVKTIDPEELKIEPKIYTAEEEQERIELLHRQADEIKAAQAKKDWQSQNLKTLADLPEKPSPYAGKAVETPKTAGIPYTPPKEEKPEEEKPEEEKLKEPEKTSVMGGIADLNFMQNLSRLIVNIRNTFIEKDGEIPNKTPFITLELIKRLYRYSETTDVRRKFHKHRINIAHLGAENWEALTKKIIEIFEKNECNFANTDFTYRAIEIFDELAENGYYYNLIPDLRNSDANAGRPWSKILKALNEINSYIQEFCAKNPHLCADTGKGSTQLLSKLKENKNISFSAWILMQETN